MPKNRVRELREASRLTLREMARQMTSEGMKISWMTISKIENPETNPSWGTVDIIARFFRVSTDYLMCRDRALTSNDSHELKKIRQDEEELPPELKTAVLAFLKKQGK